MKENAEVGLDSFELEDYFDVKAEFEEFWDNFNEIQNLSTHERVAFYKELRERLKEDFYFKAKNNWVFECKDSPYALTVEESFVGADHKSFPNEKKSLLYLTKLGDKSAVERELCFEGLDTGSFHESLIRIDDYSIWSKDSTGFCLDVRTEKAIDDHYKRDAELKRETKKVRTWFNYFFNRNKIKAAENKEWEHLCNFWRHPQNVENVSMKEFHELSIDLKDLLKKLNKAFLNI